MYIDDKRSSNGLSSNTMDEVVNSAAQVICSRTPIKPSQLNLLNKGDHIGWRRPPGLLWHHAIVHSIDSQMDEIVVIHFQKTSLREGFKILKEKLNVNEQKGDLVRFDYPNDIIESNPPEVVLDRADKKIGERGYDVFKNNCEHFATFCKTGRETSSQVDGAIKKLKETTKIDELNTFTSRSHLFPVIEVAHCVYDIFQMCKKNFANEITNKDLIKEVTQRVTECVCGTALALGLGIASEAFIGGGLTACVIGSVIGGEVGSLGGNFCGRSLGNILGGLLFG